MAMTVSDCIVTGCQGRIQPLPKARIAFQHSHVADGKGQSFRRTDQNAYLFRARNARINEIALEHYEVGHQQWHDHDRVFRPLRLVDGRGIGQRQFIEFRYIVFNRLAVEIDCQCPVFRIYFPNVARIAVDRVKGRSRRSASRIMVYI